MAKKLIEISHVNKVYRDATRGDTVALNDVSLDIYENEFVCVVGPSGCGKTTLLNIIAGLERFDNGSVTMNGVPVVGPGPDRGVIFQQYALFPWMTVKKNIEYGMKYKKVLRQVGEIDPKTNAPRTKAEYTKLTKAEKQALSEKYIKMVNLQGFEHAYPKQLSGGMKQRVAIARGYAVALSLIHI